MTSSRVVCLAVLAGASVPACSSSSLSGPGLVYGSVFEAEVALWGYQKCGSSYRSLRVPLVGTSARLVLEELTPKDQPLAALVEHIERQGDREVARGVMSSGDHLERKLPAPRPGADDQTIGVFVLPDECRVPSTPETGGIVIRFRYRLEVLK